MAKNCLVEQMYLSHVLHIDPIKIQPEYLCFYPPLLSGLAKAFQSIIHSLSFHFIFPTDPHAIPLATHLSYTHNKPLFLCLDTNAFIQQGQRALLVHTSPSAQDFYKSVKALKAHKIDVSDVLVLMDNEHIKKELFHEKGIVLHHLWDINTIEKEINKILHQNSYSKIH